MTVGWPAFSNQLVLGLGIMGLTCQKSRRLWRGCGCSKATRDRKGERRIRAHPQCFCGKPLCTARRARNRPRPAARSSQDAFTPRRGDLCQRPLGCQPWGSRNWLCPACRRIPTPRTVPGISVNVCGMNEGVRE